MDGRHVTMRIERVGWGDTGDMGDMIPTLPDARNRSNMGSSSKHRPHRTLSDTCSGTIPASWTPGNSR